MVPGSRYEAGGFRSWLLGTDYRSLWTSPIRVPVLDLQRFAGGLTATETGGGRQTLSLRLRGADGREYGFRSVAKWPAGATEPDMAGALVGSLVQDQVSSMVPAAPLAAARIADGVGIPHALATLYVMPDDPALGEFRETYGGMLGTLEERPGEQVEGAPVFGGFAEIVSTEDMLDLLEEDPTHRADVRSYVFARLLDLVLGDWDRHEDQWRWGRRDEADGVVWVPIPRDRDYAFADYDGALFSIVRPYVPNAVTFEHDFGTSLAGLLLNATPLDRQLLPGLERPVWDSIGADLQQKLTNEVIDRGLAALPTEFLALEGENIRSRLRSRRDQIPQAVALFYARAALVPRIHTTDLDEVAVLTRNGDGSVDLSVTPVEGAAADRTTFSRTFHFPETKEIRLFLRGGEDRAVVRGNANGGPIVRIIGGGGDDVLADSVSGGDRTALYDDGDDDVLVGGSGTTIDRHEYEAPVDGGVEGLIRLSTPNQGSQRDILPWVGYSSTRGALLGARVGITRFAFRHHPYHSRAELGIRYSTRWDDVEARLRAEFFPANPVLGFAAEVKGSRIDAIRFYGFGNETVDDLPSPTYVVRQETLAGQLELRHAFGDRVMASAGIVGRSTKPWVVPGSPLQRLAPLGSTAYKAAGVTSGISIAKEAVGPTDAVYRFAVKGTAFPLTSESDLRYGTLESSAGLQIPLTAAGSTRIGARLGGRYAFGDYPFFESSFLGGRETLRGFPQWRYAGDGMVYGGVEAMVPLMRLPLGLNWRTAVVAFADAGRVFLDGEDSDRWHTAPGVGLSFTALTYNVRLTYAHGPSGRVYLELGSPY